MTIVNPLAYTIANGNPVDATPVQANFQQIVNNVNANAAGVNGAAANTFDVATAVASTNATPLAQVQAQVATAVPLAGGTMTGPLILSADPTNVLGAATKEYVDNKTASLVTSFDGRTGAVTLNSGDVTGALGYTPYNSSNPSGYTTGSQFNNSLSGSGYQHMPGGLMLQWVRTTIVIGNSGNINFPTPFPNAVLAVFGSDEIASAFWLRTAVVNNSTFHYDYTNFAGSTNGQGQTVPVDFLAIGF